MTTATKTRNKHLKQVLHEKILMLRAVTYQHKSKKVIVWYAGDGTPFLGRCCHMKCMKYAREQSGVHEGRGF